MASGFLLAGRMLLKPVLKASTAPSLEQLAKAAAFASRASPEPQQRMVAASEACGGCEASGRSAAQRAAAAQGIASTSQPEHNNSHADSRAHAGRNDKREAAQAIPAARYTLVSSNSGSGTPRGRLLQHHASGHSHRPVQAQAPGRVAGLFAQAPGLLISARRAAEMLRTMSSSSSGSGSSSPGVLVKGCAPGCSCSGSWGSSSWCKFDVRIPHINWSTVLDSNPATYYSFLMGQGYERFYMPENLQVYVVKNPAHVPAALQLLRASMQDPAVAIDLEWKPEFFPPKRLAAGADGSPPRLDVGSRVAVMQLASATTCVVLHIAAMGFKLPPEAKAFLEDPAVTLVGFGWEGADERKLQGTFGFGRSAFANFVDLQDVAQDLGYNKFGLSKIAKQVMGLTLAKSKKVTMSNWAAPNLTMQQLKYASLDVLIAGQVFRGLRLWHSAPRPCPSCREPMGVRTALTLTCEECDSTYSDIASLTQHCSVQGHSQAFALCHDCGRPHKMSSTQQQQQQQQAEGRKAGGGLAVGAGTAQGASAHLSPAQQAERQEQEQKERQQGLEREPAAGHARQQVRKVAM